MFAVREIHYSAMNIYLVTVLRQILDRFAREKLQPMEHAQVYMNKYEGLITGRAEAELDRFVEEDHTFQDFADLLEFYNDMIEDINFCSLRTLRLGMYEVRSRDI